jgi:dTMP kinase
MLDYMGNIENKKGMFIAFEGIDGCGKSTQIKKFVEYLFSKDKHNHVVLTRNPYKDTDIRGILRDDDDPLTQSDKLAKLFIDDRKLQAQEIISPNIEKGHFVVSDRYKLSTITYQGAQGLDIIDLIKRHDGLPIPDITFIIDLSAQDSSLRMKNEQGRNEHKFEADLIFLEKVRQNYLKIKDFLNNEKIFIIEGKRNIDVIFKEIISIFEREYEENICENKKIKYASIKEVPEHIIKNLKKYFSNVGGDCFVIQNLPPELTGGALARYSRAPTNMQLTIINEFLDEKGLPCQEKGSELINRVLNAYGDDSIGELEGTHVGIENISQILTKTFEDRRIGGSPIEQSTRYVNYDQKDENGEWRYLRPKEIMNSILKEEYEKVNNRAFEVYSELVKTLQEYFKKQLPEEEFEIEVERNKEKIKVKKNELKGEKEEKAFRIAYGFTIRCAALDVGRCVLPSSTLTQLGIYGNGRFFTNVLSALKSGELEEEKEKGFELEEELKKVIPTFIKRNKQDGRIKIINQEMRKLSKQLFSGIKPIDESVTLVERADFLNEIVSGIIFPYADISLQQILNEVKKMPYLQKLEIIEKYRGRRETRRDRTGRGIEAGYPITFDLVGCFAEYRDLERHRMLTQQRQLLTTTLGFIMPSEVIEVGFESRVMEVVKKMEELNKELRELGFVSASQYVTLFNHRIRFMLGMNLREFQHLSELRTQPAGHFSYRAMVMKMAEQLSARDGWTNLATEFIDFSDPSNKISRAKEQSRIAGKNLACGIDGDVDFC